MQLEGKKSGNPAFSIGGNARKSVVIDHRSGEKYISVDEVLVALARYQREFAMSGMTFRPESVLDPVINVLRSLR